MPLVKDENSYVNVAEANAYFDNTIDAEGWTSATDSVKEKALMTATRMLDEESWTGIALSENQPLAFPRDGSYLDPKLGMEVTLSDSVPSRILNATIELARHLIINDNLLDETGSVLDLKVGDITLRQISASPKIPRRIKSQISPLLVTGGSRIWWRAN